MKSFLKKILFVFLTFIFVCAIPIGCTNNKSSQNDFEFTDAVIAKIDDTELAAQILDYCNKFYKHFLKECEKKLYIENSDISSTVATNLQNKIQQKMLPTILLGGDEAKKIVAFYLPFQELGAIRAKEYLDTKYDWGWENGEMTKTNQSPLTQKYINEINEQFEILKKDYFKK